MHDSCHLLARLVTLPEDHDAVLRRGPQDGRLDRCGPVPDLIDLGDIADGTGGFAIDGETPFDYAGFGLGEQNQTDPERLGVSVGTGIGGKMILPSGVLPVRSVVMISSSVHVPMPVSGSGVMLAE